MVEHNGSFYGFLSPQRVPVISVTGVLSDSAEYDTPLGKLPWQGE
jgi:hypothetical protein